MYYRKDLYQQHLGHTNPPLTWQDLVSNSLIIQHAEANLGHEIWGYPVSMDPDYLDALQAFVPFYLSWGSSLLNGTRQCNFESDKFQDALAFFTNLYKNTSGRIVPNAFQTDGSIGVRPGNIDLFINGMYLEARPTSSCRQRKLRAHPRRVMAVRDCAGFRERHLPRQQYCRCEDCHCKDPLRTARTLHVWRRQRLLDQQPKPE